MNGSDTQWYKNMLKNPAIRIDARGAEAEFRAAPITEGKAVKSVIERFREKYGAGDVEEVLLKTGCGGYSRATHPSYESLGFAGSRLSHALSTEQSSEAKQAGPEQGKGGRLGRGDISACGVSSTVGTGAAGELIIDG